MKNYYYFVSYNIYWRRNLRPQEGVGSIRMVTEKKDLTFSKIKEFENFISKQAINDLKINHSDEIDNVSVTILNIIPIKE